jgi:hypothetical protein
VTNRAPANIVKLIADTRKIATMESASFGMPGETVTYRGEEIPVDQFVKDRIRPWLSSYIQWPLKNLAAWATGGQRMGNGHYTFGLGED